MTDADLGKLVNDAIDEAGFADTFRERVRAAVEGVIMTDATSDERRASRAAGERLGTSLVSHGQDVARARRTEGGEPEDSERRAAAFRVMAGVRV
jgi:hypothetical protein